MDPWIEIDGGVTPANAYKLIDAGANALVSGSAVFGAKSYKDGACVTLVAPAAPCLACPKRCPACAACNCARAAAWCVFFHLDA